MYLKIRSKNQKKNKKVKKRLLGKRKNRKKIYLEIEVICYLRRICQIHLEKWLNIKKVLLKLLKIFINSQKMI